MAIQSGNSSKPIPGRLTPKNRNTSSISAQLTKSEIEALRQRKRQIDDYAQKHLTGWAAKLVK